VSIAPGSVARLNRLGHFVDELRSTIDLALNARDAAKAASPSTSLALPSSEGILKLRRIRNLTRVFHKTLKKMYDTVDDLHKKFAHFLVMSYDLVLLPMFRSSLLVLKRNKDGKKRRINNTAVRNMLSWRHGAFRRFLLDRAELTPCVVDLVCEAYTSKTCGRCGEINDKLGSKKHFLCPSDRCGYAADRDANAARNILIRNASKYLYDKPHA